MRLSTYFETSEFENGPSIPPECLPIFTFLCREVLEPTRSFASEPLRITSGYRSAQTNAAAHGQPNSEHMATPDFCACDFFVTGRPVREVFDWMRLNATLPYHQLIYETSANGSAVIHVSVNKAKPGLRSVLSGATHNSERYTPVDFVPFAGEQAENA